MDYPFDLGTYARPVTTSSATAQTWFDRGLNWTYAYNHEEAVECFRRAAEADPHCAMAFWGIAYAAGPNYNMPWHLFDPKGRALALKIGHEAAQTALSLVDSVTAPEAALIRALPARYPQADPADDMLPWLFDYCDAMRAVASEHPEDLDIQAIFAEAIMNRTPWQMWDLSTGAAAKDAQTADAVTLLERIFAEVPASWDHPGLLHLYVHLMEMSPFPERALRHGDRLRGMVPDAGHLIHMPTHIDVLCGDYRDTLHYNLKAHGVDAKYKAWAGALNRYTGYRIHNLHFAIYGAMFLGQYQPALEAAEALMAELPEEVLRLESPPMADFTEGYFAMKQHVLIRFGRWAEILAQPLPKDAALYTCTTALMRYARSVAHSALGNVPEAEAEARAFDAARTRVTDRRRVHNNIVPDLLDIASEMLRGELEYRRGNHDVAFDHLRRSVALDDALPYDEPWGWMQPARHALGALLSEQGRMEEAEAVYRADLGLDGRLARSSQHPGNIWSLTGLDACLAARGERVERAHIRRQLDIARARADVPVKASCFCARSAMA
ncbi:tetratricopeptide repeat protein [Oceanibium sediminis]|uniref:tetratricopeptide repeat protein n=1 Tax=Oceanibium sediminis TaxID=2026339 RepID=UPI000DD45989|nr:tetratricopeptide repeat protein [Oceanibium sediminis]